MRECLLFPPNKTTTTKKVEKKLTTIINWYTLFCYLNVIPAAAAVARRRNGWLPSALPVFQCSFVLFGAFAFFFRCSLVLFRSLNVLFWCSLCSHVRKRSLFFIFVLFVPLCVLFVCSFVLFTCSFDPLWCYLVLF